MTHPLPRRTSVHRVGTWTACLALTALLVPPAAAQSGPAAGAATASSSSVVTRDADGRVVVRATRIAEPVRIDGQLDEAVYGAVPVITELIQQEPNTGAPVSEKTEVWLMFDNDNIYLSCRCWDEHPERIVANDMRRDGSRQTAHDNFTVTLDTFHDRRNGFLFGITAAGGLRDGQTTDERPNMNWNAVYEGKVSRFAGGWTAEMAIPFRSLRYIPGRNETWGIQIRRFIASKNERAHLTAISPASGTLAINFMSLAANMVDIDTPPPAKNIEIKPYAIAGLTTDRLSKPPVSNAGNRDAGIDVKYGVTNSLTADFTYNTDFAQVEADDAQVNLTRFSLSLPEKREFFLEGGGIFAFGSAAGGVGDNTSDAPTIFYSRRIGLNGAREVPVIGGGRFSGKAGAWGIGALNLETDDEPVSNARKTNFTVLRLRREVLRRSAIGGLYTRRSVSTAGPGANDVWGLDANLAFYQNLYVAGYVAQSRSEANPTDNLAYRAQMNYAADRYGLAIDRLVVDPKFDPEVGFLRRKNFRRNAAQARFSPRPRRNPHIRKFTYQGNLEYVTDEKNHLESREVSGLFRTEFQNSDTVTVEHLRLYEFLAQPFEVSSGVKIPAGGYPFVNSRISYNAGQNHRVSGTYSFETGSFYDGTKQTAGFNGRIEITPQLGVEPNISLNWVDLPEGSFTNTVVTGRATFTMTAEMFVAALVQHSSATASLLANVRFRWEYHPGSEFFVVFTEGRSTLPAQGTDLQSRGIVVKFNRLFRY